MHAYDVPRRQSYQPVPSGRSAQGHSGRSSATPIYDELCSEYVRSFRAFPGDRSGEEELAFTAFANTPQDAGSYGGTYGMRHGAPQHATGHLTTQHGHTATAASLWQQVARHATAMHHVPALPPAPRKGL